MSKNKREDIDRHERILKIVHELAQICDRQQQYHSNKAQEFGYARDVFVDVKDQIINIPYGEPLLIPAEQSLIKFREFIEEKEKTQEYHTDISSIAFILNTSVAATSSFIEPKGELFEIHNSPNPPSFWPQDKNEKYAARLEKLDYELARVYRSVRNSFFGNKENPERTALYQMRQAYDHFFDILAPADKVRASEYFKKKADNDPDKVYRKERLHYAANAKVKDTTWRELLLKQDDYIIGLYDRLNIAHKRSSLARKEVKEILDAMLTILEQWIDAIGL